MYIRMYMYHIDMCVYIYIYIYIHAYIHMICMFIRVYTDIQAHKQTQTDTLIGREIYS